ncbi:MAG: hypothetical protein E7270_02125 [Lachnospiraceae bacterium]|nr:hypothetical protein [Lachnospiraceae bacterium]
MDLGKYYHNKGIEQGLNDDELYAYQDAMLRSDLSALLDQYLGSNGTDASQKDAIIQSFMKNDTASMYALNGEMVSASALIS